MIKSPNKPTAAPTCGLRGPRTAEVILSLFAWALVVACLFHEVSIGGRTACSAPHQAFTLPNGPVGMQHSGPIPLADAPGPGWIHEACHLYRERAFLAGEFPHWMPHTGCGNPYFATYMAGVLFPPNWLMFAVDPPLGFDLAYLSRLVIAGWLLYLFLRVHRIRWLGAFLGGLMFVGSGRLIGGLNLSDICVEGLAPGLLLAFELVISRGRRSHFVLCAVVVALMLVAGNPQSAALAFLVGGVYAAARIYSVSAGRPAWALARVAAACIVGALLSAPQLLPFLEYVPLASHHHHAMAAGFLPVETAILWIVPGFYKVVYQARQLGESGGFYGIATLGWIMIAASFLERPRTARLLSLLGLMALGGWLYGAPILRILSTVPILNQIQLHRYLTGPITLVAATLAGVGFDRLTRSEAMGLRLVIGSVLVGAIPLTFTLLWSANSLRCLENLALQSPAKPYLGWIPCVLLAALGLAAVASWIPRLKPAAIVLIVGIAAIETWTHKPHQYPARADIFREPPGLASIVGDRRSFRVYSPDSILRPNTSAAFGLNDIRFALPLVPARYEDLVSRAFVGRRGRPGRLSTGRHPIAPPHALSVLGVRYILCKDELECVGRLPLNGGVRHIVHLDLSGMTPFLHGKVEGSLTNENQPDVVLAVDKGVVVGIEKMIAGEASGEVRLSDSNSDGEILHYLACTTAAGTSLVIDAVDWCGVRLSTDQVHAGLVNRRALIGDEPFHLRGTAVIALPTASSGQDRVLTVRARLLGKETAQVALLRQRGRALPLKMEPLSPDASQFSLDLRDVAGTLQQVSIEPHPGTRVTSLRLSHSSYELRGHFDSVRVYENTRALPRAFGVHQVEEIAGDEEQLNRLLDPSFPYTATVITEDLPDRPTLPSTPPRKTPRIAWIAERPGGAGITLRAEFSAPGLLVLLDNYIPGWEATVDERSVPIYRANYAFRAVPVPAGTHTIRFEYTPKGWRLGVLCSILGLAILFVLILVPDRALMAHRARRTAQRRDIRR